MRAIFLGKELLGFIDGSEVQPNSDPVNTIAIKQDKKKDNQVIVHTISHILISEQPECSSSENRPQRG